MKEGISKYVDIRYTEIVRDNDMLEVAREEAVSTFSDKYTECYSVIPDPQVKNDLIEMAIQSYANKWTDALNEYRNNAQACSLADKEACEKKQNREYQLASFIQKADDERHEMGALPFIPERFKSNGIPVFQSLTHESNSMPKIIDNDETQEVVLFENAAY